MTAIHWLNAINGSFTNPTDWVGGTVPGTSDDAILDAFGSAFTVTSGVSETVESVQLAPNATLSLTAGTFTARDGTGSGANAGVVLIGAGATFATAGIVVNSGTIALYGSTGMAKLGFDGNATLTGGGEIFLGGQGGNAIGSDLPHGRKHHYSILYNSDNTIIGLGTIGDSQILIVNEAGGTIDANGSAPLVFNGNVASNSGLIEATGSGGLILDCKSFGGPTSGTLLAGNGSHVFVNKTRIEGATFESNGSGYILANTTYFYDTIVNNANLVLDGAVLVGTLTNNGNVTADNIGIGGATLKGYGVLALAGQHIQSYSSRLPGLLTLASGTIAGFGSIGGPSHYNTLALTIGEVGLVDGNGASELTINTLTRVITNAGTIESTASGGVLIESSIDSSGILAASSGVFAVGTSSAPEAIVNSGTISVSGTGTLIAYGAVTGKGVAKIAGGTLDFASTFNQGVKFTRTTGVLELADSQAFTNTIGGFSKTETTGLDLRDIGFVSSNEATFSGTSSGGVLTVTDGTHTAHIKLNGNYLGSTFIASSDGTGGVDIVAASGQTSSAAHFVSAMAAITGHLAGAGLIDPRAVSDSRQMMLAAPRLALA